MNKYDVIIVGAGPGGIFSALNLIENNPNLKILILEKGKPVSERAHTGRDLTQGFGGCGSFSDGKLCLSLDKEYGGNLQEYIKDLSLFSVLMNKVDETHMRFSDEKEIKLYGDDLEKIEPIKIKAAQNGMTLLSARVRHLGTDNNEKIMQNVYNFLKDKVEIRFGCEVSDFEKQNDFKVIYKKDDVEYEEESKYLILMPGRGGTSWFEKIAKNHNLKVINNQVDVGVRVEFPEWIGRDIGNILYEPKLVMRTPNTDLRARTFCWNNAGFVVRESVKDESGNDIWTANGHSNSKGGKKSNNSNFALLVSAVFTEPFNQPTVYGKSVAKLCNLLGDGIIVQRLRDLKANHRTTAKRLTEMNLQPTLKEATPGDISYCLPAKQLNAIMESIEILDKLFPGLNGSDTILYAPEIKWYSARASLTNKLESEIINLFCGGDGCGISRGIVQAAMSGLVVSEEILEREK